VRVDSGGGKLPAPDEVDGKPDFVARSVTLASETLGIIAKMDLVEGATWVHRLERCGMGLRQRPSEKLTLAESSTGNLLAEQNRCSIVGSHRRGCVALIGELLHELFAVRLEPIRRDVSCFRILDFPGHGASFRSLEGAKAHERIVLARPERSLSVQNSGRHSQAQVFPSAQHPGRSSRLSKEAIVIRARAWRGSRRLWH
jgi:hypothetical protein